MAIDIDAGLIPIFTNRPVQNPTETLRQGRPIWDDRICVDVHIAGRKDWGSYPAFDQSHWARDPETGEQRMVTYAERWPKQFQQYMAKQQQTKSGTPLDQLPFLTDARRAELRALNIHTAEALASIDGQELKNLGINGRELKLKATEYIENAARGAVPQQILVELETMRAQNKMLQEDLQAIKQGSLKQAETKVDSQFAGMNEAEMMDWIEAQTGDKPVGRPNMATLLQMANEIVTGRGV